MSKTVNHDLYIVFLISVSFFTLFLIGSTIIFPPIIQEETGWRKPAISLIYQAICVLGIIAAFFPSRCIKMLNHKSQTTKSVDVDPLITKNRVVEDTTLFLGWRMVHGHHSQCKAFDKHELTLGNKTFCIGCLSFSLGAMLSIIVMNLYLFNIWHVGNNHTLVASLGLLMVGFGLLHVTLFNLQGIFRLVPNSLVVIGATFSLIGVDALVQNYFLDAFILVSSLFWVWTKISISQRDHLRICRVCETKC